MSVCHMILVLILLQTFLGFDAASWWWWLVIGRTGPHSEQRTQHQTTIFIHSTSRLWAQKLLLHHVTGHPSNGRALSSHSPLPYYQSPKLRSEGWCVACSILRCPVQKKSIEAAFFILLTCIHCLQGHSWGHLFSGDRPLKTGMNDNHTIETIIHILYRQKVQTWLLLCTELAP